MTTRKYHSAEQRRRHVHDWQQSDLSKNAYALQHDLNVKTFGNWTRLPREKPADAASPVSNAFIIARPASPQPVPVAGTATLNLPDGCSVTAGTAALAALIRELNLC